MTFEALEIGKRYEMETHVSTEMVSAFAEVSGDRNPVHLDDDYANGSIFKGKIIHGMIVGALFSKVLATDFPGPGSVYLNQTMSFRRPIYHDSDLKIVVKVIALNEAKRVVTLSTDCEVNGKVAVTGEAVIKMLPHE